MIKHTDIETFPVTNELGDFTVRARVRTFCKLSVKSETMERRPDADEIAIQNARRQVVNKLYGEVASLLNELKYAGTSEQEQKIHKLLTQISLLY